jgi:uncharacterized membrane protein
MRNLTKYGRLQFAIALIGFGIQHIIVQRFTMGESSSWPASVSGGIVWAYLSGLFLVFTGTMLLLNKNATPSLMIAGTMIFLWAFIRDLPAFIMHPVYDWELSRMGEALAMAGCCFVVANSFILESKPFKRGSFLFWLAKLMLAGPICIAIFLLICGAQHFILTQYVQTLVPSWIPGALFWTYLAGVALIFGGIGLIWPRTRRVAALWSGLMIFIWMAILHTPRVAHSMHNTDEWNSLLETMTLSGALFVLAFSTKKESAE